MKYTQFTAFLLAIIIMLSLNSCGDEDLPRNIVIAGDRSHVDNFFRFDQQEIPFSSETETNGLVTRRYSTPIDLNEDGFNDMRLSYETSENANGYEAYNFTLNRVSSAFQVHGIEQNVLGNDTVVPTFLAKDERIDFNQDIWNRIPIYTYLVYIENDNGQNLIEYNAFPEPGSEAYLMFKFPDLSNRTVTGWMRIMQTEDDLRIKIIDTGYKYMD